MAQQARNLTAADGFLADRRFLLMDRDASFSERFRAILATGDVESVRTPPQSPNCNAFIERFFRSMKEECLRRIIPFSVDGLRRAIGQFIEHYHEERPHQGLDGALIQPGESEPRPTGPIRCRERLGGILRHYYRSAG